MDFEKLFFGMMASALFLLCAGFAAYMAAVIIDPERMNTGKRTQQIELKVGG